MIIIVSTYPSPPPPPLPSQLPSSLSMLSWFIFHHFFASQRHADIAEGLASKLEDFASVSVPIPRPLDANGQVRPLPTQ